jgi:hypothetical protein
MVHLSQSLFVSVRAADAHSVAEQPLVTHTSDIACLTASVCMQHCKEPAEHLTASKVSSMVLEIQQKKNSQHALVTKSRVDGVETHNVAAFQPKSGLAM